MYPHGAQPSLTPSPSRPRVVSMLAPQPVPLHVTSSRKVHRSADGIINIIQEISFYAEGGVKSQAGKQLKEVHAQPTTQVRGHFSAETNARVFVGSSIIRMHIQTSIQPNASDSLEIDEYFHFAENQEALVFPIEFEGTLEREEGETPAAEFDLSSTIVVTLKQRILKDQGEQYKVFQAIELRANESETRPTQELARKSTISQPSNDAAQFHERIFAGTDVLRVERDIGFVCDRPVLSLSERREYMPSCPMAPRRRSASLTRSVSRVSCSPAAPRSRSQSRSSTGNEDSENCHTASEDLPTATSPYSLREDENNSRIPPCSGLDTGREASPSNTRSSRSQRKKWTVNSVVSKADARTPDVFDRTQTMSTASNLSLSPANRSSDHHLKTAQTIPSNGEIAAINATSVVPTVELGPHGESQLVEGMDLLRVVAPADSLIRTCAEGRSPTRTRSASNCSTADEIPTCASASNCASQSPPFSSPLPMPRTYESSASSRPCTPLRTARDASPRQQSAPSSGTARLQTRNDGASPMRTALRAELSPVQTAVHVKRSATGNAHKSQKSQKQSHKESKRSDKSGKRTSAKPSDSSSPNLPTARNLFGTVASNESVARMVTARTPDLRTAAARSGRSPALTTARGMPPIEQKCRHPELPHPTIPLDSQPLNIDDPWANYNSDSRFGKHGETEQVYPFRPIEFARQRRTETRSAHSPATLLTGRVASPAGTNNSTDRLRTAAERSSATPLDVRSPMTRRVPQPRMLFGDILTSPPAAVKTAHPLAYEKNVTTGRESRSPMQSLKTTRNSPYEKTARERSDASPACGLPTARGNTDRSPALMTARQSPYDKSARSPAFCTSELSPYEQTVNTAHAARSPAQSLKYARNSPYEKSARERSHASPARGLAARSPTSLKTPARTAYEQTARSPAAGIRTAAEYGRSPIAPRSARSPMVTSRTQSPATRSAISNVVTAQGARSPHVDTGSPNNLATAREQRLFTGSILCTAREHSRGFGAVSPVNLKTARQSSKSPARHLLKTAATRTPEHNTMPDSEARQEDSYSEQSQFTFQKTPRGFTQKPTHSSELVTGQQRTPTKNLSQHASLESTSPLVRTAVDHTTPRKQSKMEEVPKCSLKTGCQAIHAPRVILSGPDSDKDREEEFTRSPIAAPKTPEKSLRTARAAVLSSSAPFGDMRTPRTARAAASSASSHVRSPATSAHMITAVSPVADANNNNEDVATARGSFPPAASPRPRTTALDWAAAAGQPTAKVTSKPRVIVRADQANGKICVEMCLSVNLNTTGSIRVRGEVATALNPRTVSVNGQKIWSDASRP